MPRTLQVRIEKLPEKIKVYNLEIEGLHTYFVAGGVLVHNGCGDDYWDDESPHNERVGRSQGSAPRDNKKQNKQIKEIAKKLGLDNNELEILHDIISHQGYSFGEILELAKEYFGK